MAVVVVYILCTALVVIAVLSILYIRAHFYKVIRRVSLFLIVYLKQKDPTEHNGREQHAAKKVEEEDSSFFPRNRALSVGGGASDADGGDDYHDDVRMEPISRASRWTVWQPRGRGTAREARARAAEEARPTA